MKFLLNRGLKDNLPTNTLPGELLLATNEAGLHSADDFGGVAPVSDMHVGEEAPLQDYPLWLKESTRELFIKDVNGAYIPAPKAIVNNVDFKGFQEQVWFSPSPGEKSPVALVSLSNDWNWDMYYTMDGTEPTAASNFYTTPFSTGAETATVKVLCVNPVNVLDTKPVFEAIYVVATFAGPWATKVETLRDPYEVDWAFNIEVSKAVNCMSMGSINPGFTLADLKTAALNYQHYIAADNYTDLWPGTPLDYLKNQWGNIYDPALYNPDDAATYQYTNWDNYGYTYDTILLNTPDQMDPSTWTVIYEDVYTILPDAPPVLPAGPVIQRSYWGSMSTDFDRPVVGWWRYCIAAPGQGSPTLLDSQFVIQPETTNVSVFTPFRQYGDWKLKFILCDANDGSIPLMESEEYTIRLY
jgi:hypothetical protein